MKKPELLAPAGTFEKAKIAFLYGADAVYAGTSSLSLRTRAGMDDNDLANTIKYAHSIGKKVYAALNIFAWDEKYEEVKEQAKMLNDLKVDGIIVADGGVVEIVKEYAPDCDIHISTQANTISYHASKFWYNNGAKRVILGREMNKEQIKELIKNKPDDLEVEMFIHGAICFGYSGRCFLSDFLAGRSANLGDCAQSCRWAYNVYVEEKNNPGNLMPVENDEKGTYIFSSKDLCLVNEIPEICEMGVDSLKIEGRLKTEYYIASVVNTYRNAIDDYMNNPENYDGSKYIKELEKTKTRGLTTFYFNDRNNKDFQEYEGKQYNLEYEFGGKVVETGDKKDIIEIRNKLSVGDEMEILIPGKLEPVKFVINKLWDIDTDEEINTVNPGVANQKVKMKLPIKAEKDWILRRKK
ncbi:MAG: U32 family peptidase [Clostridia bacterium]|nr:U32 family peptidase [Clostridia bacterium]